MAPISGESRAAMWLLFLTGAATAVAATAVMLVRADVKGALAWSTAGQMGFMGVQIAVGALGAALFHIVGHAMYKAALFLGAGGAIASHGAARHLPRVPNATARPIRFVVAALLPAAAMAGALAVLDPHGGAGALVLIATFGWLAAARLVNGWLRSTSPSSTTIGVGIVAAAGAPLLYVGGVVGFEHFVDAALVETPAAVPAWPLIAAIAFVATLGSVIRLGATGSGSRLYRLVHGLLLGLGAPPVPSLRRGNLARAGGVHHIERTQRVALAASPPRALAAEHSRANSSRRNAVHQVVRSAP
jgi:NADH-quinone oxidoreductase subunit L/NAD(P)H-quinone oxidoreductase subunit 5